MSSSSGKPNAATAFPVVPPSLRSESFETSDVQKTRQAHAQIEPTYTPYLGLPSRLSQIWINRWTVLLLLVLVRVVLLIAQLNENVGEAKSKALSACTKVEDVGSAMASMPHYLSTGVNDLAASSIEKAVVAMVKGLDLIMLGVQGIIFFYINFLTATYVCLITALIHGSLDVVTSVTEGATKAFNKIIDGATHEIEDIAGGLEKAINKVTNGIENSIIGHFVPDIPKVDFSEPLENLKKFSLNSDDFVKDVRKLNKDLPNFDQVQNLTKQAIAIPFDIARKALNEGLGNYRFNRDVFPLAKRQRLTFCSDNDKLEGFFGNLFELVRKARTIFIVLLSILAAVAMAPMAWLEMRRWRRQQKHAGLIAKNQFDPMDVVYIASRPVTARCGIKASSRLKGRQQVLVRWCVAYATSAPAIFVLSLAVAGFFSCSCQLIILKAIEKEVPALAGQVGDFAGDVVKALENVSDEWAADANGVVKGLNDDINRDVLLYITNATDAVNDTINTFVNTMQEELETVFNGTILLAPIKSVLHCVIGIKIESVQKGLTWVHDHARINFPLFLSSPSSATTDEVSGTVNHVTTWLYNGIIQEALISTAVLLVYLVVVLLGVTRTLVCMAVPDRNGVEEDAICVKDDGSSLASGPGPVRWEKAEVVGKNYQDEM